MKRIDDQIIWDYLDGILSEENRRELELLITQDIQLKLRVESICIFHQLLIDEKISYAKPSQSFTRQLMNRYRQEYSVGTIPNVKLRSKWLFFVVTLLTLVCMFVLVSFSITDEMGIWAIQNTNAIALAISIVFMFMLYFFLLQLIRITKTCILEM